MKYNQNGRGTDISIDEMQDIVSSTTGKSMSPPEATDKQLDDLMYFVFGDILDQEDSYDY